MHIERLLARLKMTTMADPGKRRRGGSLTLPNYPSTAAITSILLSRTISFIPLLLYTLTPKLSLPPSSFSTFFLLPSSIPTIFTDTSTLAHSLHCHHHLIFRFQIAQFPLLSSKFFVAVCRNNPNIVTLVWLTYEHLKQVLSHVCGQPGESFNYFLFQTLSCAWSEEVQISEPAFKK